MISNDIYMWYNIYIITCTIIKYHINIITHTITCTITLTLRVNIHTHKISKVLVYVMISSHIPNDDIYISYTSTLWWCLYIYLWYINTLWWYVMIYKYHHIWISIITMYLYIMIYKYLVMIRLVMLCVYCMLKKVLVYVMTFISVCAYMCGHTHVYMCMCVCGV